MASVDRILVAHASSLAESFGRADKDPAPTRRVAVSFGAVGTTNIHKLHRRISVIELVRRTAKTNRRRLQDTFRLPESPHERHTHFMRSGLYLDARLKTRIGRMHVGFEFGRSLGVAGKSLGHGGPLASPPTVKRLMRTPSSRISIWLGSPMPTM